MSRTLLRLVPGRPLGFLGVCCLAGGLFLLAARFISSPASSPSTGVSLVGEHVSLGLVPGNHGGSIAGDSSGTFLPGYAADSVPVQEGAADSSTEEAWLRQAMRVSPAQTLVMIKAMPDQEMSQRLLVEAVKIWAAEEGRNALGWVMMQHEDLRSNLLEAVAQGMAGEPALAIAIGHELLARDVDAGTSFGNALLANLAATDQHLLAVEFAAAVSGERGEGWLAAALRRWVEAQPGAAAEALGAVRDPRRNRVVFDAVMKGWVVPAPAAVADYVVALPAGGDRDQAFNIVLDHWGLMDPQALGEWFNTAAATGPALTPAERNRLAEVLATRTDAAQRTPEVARAWAELITDPELRARCFAQIDRQQNPLPVDESAGE